MTIRNLDRLFAPKSVVLIGASERPASVGLTTARNLLTGGFQGRVSFVNPKRTKILGHACASSIDALSEAPDLAVVATPPDAVPATIAELACKGTRAAVVITAGLGPGKQQMLDAARPHLFRILGPNCLGLIVPGLGLNASFAERQPATGDLAFVSQSGALLTAIIDWAAGRSIGFSYAISLGEMADVDFGDVLDYLSADAKTRAILLYMEAVTNAPKFLSAARRAACVKPVIVVKSGRHAAGARAALSHTGRLAGSDAAYEAAFRRAGMLRVKTLPDLFAAAEILARSGPLKGERLAILTNGGGAGVLAADELQDAQGTLAALGPEAKARLDVVLPPTWSKANPVDIIGDAGPERYRDALTALLADPASDAVLVIQCPTAVTSSLDTARAVIETVTATRSRSAEQKLVLTNWLGEATAHDPRLLFAAAGLATFETPSEAIAGFSHVARYARAQRELTQTPPAMREGAPHDSARVSHAIKDALRAGTTVLSAAAAKALLACYGIPVAETRIAPTPDAAAREAAAILAASPACVVKILSAAISHKSDVGGVRLGLETAEAAAQAAREMLARAKAAYPAAIIDGFMIEPMIRRPEAQEMIIGMSVDPTFGPLLMFGAGGTAVEVLADRALGLPPLDLLLARQMIEETRISRLLAGYRDRPRADLDALAEALVNVSEAVIRHPEIREIDINPLLVDANGIIALDARVRLEDEASSPRTPLAIRPYPAAWEKRLDTFDTLGDILIRPIRPEDAPKYSDFIAHLSPSDLRLRFFTARRSLSQATLARFTQIDYAREMAFVALASGGALLGVVRLALDPDLTTGEYGIIVRSDLKGHGLGWVLMQHLIAYARSEGVARIVGLVLAENQTMLDMAGKLGFKIRAVDEDAGMREVILTLREA